MRTIVEGYVVRGANTGITVPHHIFSISQTFGEITIGTAIVRTPDHD